eukprot:4359148-Karenia_brevis.AAC.1
MTEVAELQYSNLSATETRKLRENLLFFISYFGQTISLGTACSGADIWYGVWDILVRLWHKVLGMSMSVTRSFSCEKVEFKSRWIQEHCGPQVVFKDTADISNPVAETWQGDHEPVPR